MNSRPNRIESISSQSRIPNQRNEPLKQGICANILIIVSYVLFILTLPFSLFSSIKIVKEYERAVIFRLGRIRPEKSTAGPGVFFHMPCIDWFMKVDLRTITFDGINFTLKNRLICRIFILIE
jgi:hypothetical protein